MYSDKYFADCSAVWSVKCSSYDHTWDLGGISDTLTLIFFSCFSTIFFSLGSLSRSSPARLLGDDNGKFQKCPESTLIKIRRKNSGIIHNFILVCHQLKHCQFQSLSFPIKPLPIHWAITHPPAEQYISAMLITLQLPAGLCIKENCSLLYWKGSPCVLKFGSFLVVLLKPLFGLPCCTLLYWRENCKGSVKQCTFHAIDHGPKVLFQKQLWEMDFSIKNTQIMFPAYFRFSISLYH